MSLNWLRLGRIVNYSRQLANQSVCVCSTVGVCLFNSRCVSVQQSVCVCSTVGVCLFNSRCVSVQQSVCVCSTVGVCLFNSRCVSVQQSVCVCSTAGHVFGRWVVANYLSADKLLVTKCRYVRAGPVTSPVTTSPVTIAL